MGFVISVTAAMIVWLVLWALGWKGQDAFIIAAVMLIATAGARIASGYLPSRRDTSR